MAEIVRWKTETSQETVYRNRQGTAEVTNTERVRVSSLRSDRLDVSVLFDLVHALDVAGVTKGLVSAHRSDAGHLTQLVVEAVIEVGAAESEVDRGSKS